MVIWSLVSRGFSAAKIAEKLETTRQYVNQTRIATEAKLTSMLLEVAEMNDLQIQKVYAGKAILLGYSPVLRQKVIITYTTCHGIKIWYWHDKPEDVTDPVLLKKTRQYLLDIAKERGIIDIQTNAHPAKMADKIFSMLLPELKS
jgi:hypothetical protein